MKTIVFNSIQVTNYWFTLHCALRFLYQQAQTFSFNIQGISDQNVTHMMLKRVRCRIEKCVKFSDSYRSQKSEILYDSQKAYRATNEMIFNSVAIQLLHTILVEQAD